MQRYSPNGLLSLQKGDTFKDSDCLVNIPLTALEILTLKEQAKNMHKYCLANKQLLLSKKWEYNVTTQLEGESNVLEGPLD